MGSEKYHVHSNLDFIALEDWERQGAGIAPGETWAGCTDRASSSCKPASPALLDLGNQLQTSGRSETGTEAAAKPCPGRSLGSPTVQAQGPCSLFSCVALLLICLLLFPRVAADPQVVLLRYGRGGQGLSAGV